MAVEQMHMAYQSSPAQHQRGNEYLEIMRGPNPRPAPDLLSAMLNDMLENTLQYYLLMPAEMLEIKGGLLRVIKVGVGVMSKAATFLLKRTISSLSTQQAIDSADYIENTRVLSEDDAGNEISYIAFPIMDRTARELEAIVARIKDGHYGRAEKAQLTAVMVQIVEAGIDCFMREPIKMMGFSGLMGKLAQNTEQTIVKSLDRLISDMFPKLTHDQAIRYAAYLEETMLTVELEEVEAEA